jgi:hypothetical protein
LRRERAACTRFCAVSALHAPVFAPRGRCMHPFLRREGAVCTRILGKTRCLHPYSRILPSNFIPSLSSRLRSSRLWLLCPCAAPRRSLHTPCVAGTNRSAGHQNSAGGANVFQPM